MDGFSEYDLEQILCHETFNPAAAAAVFAAGDTEGLTLPSSPSCGNISLLLDYYEASMSSYDTQTRISLPIFLSIIFTLGIVGNSLVVHVVIHHGAMKTVTNLYLSNLAITDLLFLVVCVPFTGLQYLLPEWPFGTLMCKMVNYMMLVTNCGTALTVTAMSIDRYQAVVYPVRSKTYRTVKLTIGVIVTIWAISFLACIPTMLASKSVQYWDLGEMRSFCVQMFSPRMRKTHTLLVFILCYIIPICIITTAYFLMARKVWRTTIPHPNQLPANAIRASRHRCRVTRMVFIIVLTFAISWLPLYVIYVNNDFGKNVIPTPALYVSKIVALCMAYANSALNPFIYGFMSHNFRRCFVGTFQCPNKLGQGIFVLSDPEQIKGGSSSNSRQPNNIQQQPQALQPMPAQPEAAQSVQTSVVMVDKSSRGIVCPTDQELSKISKML